MTTSPVVVVLIWLGAACIFLISGMFLDAHGWPYSLQGSAIPFKIHPGSYFILAAFFIFILQNNPVVAVYRLTLSLPAHFFYMTTVICLIAYVLARFGTNGSAFMIDLHLMPVMAAVLLSRMPTQTLAKLFVASMLCLTLNSFIGIAEYFLQARLTPFLVDGKPVEELYFRPTALLGHPLQNAIVTAVGVALIPVVRTQKILFFGCGAIIAASLVFFGGRSAFAVVSIIAVVALPWWGMRRVIRRDYSYQQLIGGTLAVICVAGGGVAALMTFASATRVFSNFHWDNSANTRLIGLRVLEMVSQSDIIFGIGQSEIIQRSKVLADYYGIIGLENSWLLLLLIFGAIGLAFFIVAMFAWFREMLAGASSAVYLAAITYFLIASTNNTLAAKDCSLTQLVILLCGAQAYAMSAAGFSRRSRADLVAA